MLIAPHCVRHGCDHVMVLYWCSGNSVHLSHLAWCSTIMDTVYFYHSVADRTTFDGLEAFYDQLTVMHEEKVPPLVIGNHALCLIMACVVVYHS
jgi:hypothetical protein